MDEALVRREIGVMHFGDVLYGSAFLSPAPERSAERRRAQTEAMNRMFRYIREQSVSLALITGNLFDEADLSDETALYLIRSMRSLSDCRFVICPGPADRFTEACFYASGRLPENVHVFTEEAYSSVRFAELGVTVYGAAVTAPDAAPAPLPVCSREAGDTVFLCGYRSEMPSESELRATGADYVAFSGSSDWRLRDYDGLYFAYSGSPETRDYKDEALGGANYVVISEQEGKRCLHIKRMEFGSCRVLSREIDVSEMRNDTDLIAAITRIVRDNGLGRNAILRVVFRGETKPGFRIPSKFEGSAFGLMIFSAVNLTTPVLDPQLRRDMSAKGELYRLLEPKMSSGSDAERAAAARALTIGLTALEGKPIDNL